MEYSSIPLHELRKMTGGREHSKNIPQEYILEKKKSKKLNESCKFSNRLF